MWPNSHIKLYLTLWDFRLRGWLANAFSLITNFSALLLVKISCNTSNWSLEIWLSHSLNLRCLWCYWPAYYAISYLLPISSLGKQRKAHSSGKYSPSLQNVQWQIWRMANAFHVYPTTTFQKDIVVDSVHSQNYINKALVTPDEVGFTIHILFEQLKSWYETKKATLVDYTYVQVLNGFIGKKSLFKIQENCSRVEECLRLNCTRVAKQFLGKNGRRRQNLLPNSKSIAIHQGEFRTGGSVALLGDLEYQISRLENINTTITQDNKDLNLNYKETSTLLSQTQTKFDKVTVDIEKLKWKNNNLYKIIEKISPKRRFEDKGKTISDIKRQQDRKLKILATRIEQALWCSESFGLHLDGVNFISSDPGKSHSISFEEKLGLKSCKEIQNEEQKIFNKFCI